MNLDLARLVADAVLYEGYLLYPYRASSSKNQARWQFGVLGPPGASERGLGEVAGMSMQCLLEETASDEGGLALHVRFLQLQRRQVLDADGHEVVSMEFDGTSVLSWDEAVERELSFTTTLAELAVGLDHPLSVDGGEEVEPLLDAQGATAGQVVRRRWPMSARLRASTTLVGGPVDGLLRLDVAVENVHDGSLTSKDDMTRRSFLGTHLIIEAHGADFVSLLEPPESASAAAAACTQRRCWPVLSGAPGDTHLLLGLPIILYDYPEIAAESPGALFDATEIDEILTLRVLTMTDAEKAEARATDPRAREIIDRCDEMTPETLQQMHGVLRSPHAEDPFAPFEGEIAWPGVEDIEGLADVRDAEPPTFETDVPWWDPETDAAVQPDVDAVTIDGIRVARGSLVRVHPNRRADAQDLFFADQVARVTAVLSDVDGGTHVALVLVDDPASDLHDWYGRYFYFAPDELEPLPDTPGDSSAADITHREEIHP